MASVAQLKLWFARGLKPTQEQFAAWLDSFWHKNDTIPAANVEGYASILGKRISGTVINESGHLIVSLADGSSFDAGMAVGMPGTDGDNGLTPYIGGNGNWFIGTTDTGIKAEGTNGNDGYTPYIQGGYWYINGTNTGVIAAGTNGDDGITPHIGGNGNWFIGATDTGVKAVATNGINGTNAPVTMAIYQIGANGMALPRKLPAYPYDRIISAVRLSSDCSGLSAKIGATDYNHITLVGVTIPANVELIINYLTVSAGNDSADALIIF